MNTELENLCYPVFNCICNYWQLSCITNMVNKDKFRQDITALLSDAGEKAQANPQLEKEFNWIKKPLVFFIDYIVKEGRFSFREEWMELARNYNELSGDEKFYDFLDSTLENPDFNNSVVLFYIMMGLGFNGVYNFNNKHVEQCMRLCMEKTATDFDIFSQPLVPERKKKPHFLRRRKNHIRTAIIICFCFMALSFFINLAVFADLTESYRLLLRHTASNSIPQTGYYPREASLEVPREASQEEGGL